MKKLLLAVALITLMGSCKKDYICTCTFTDLDPNDSFSLEGAIPYEIKDQKKKDAETICEADSETDEFTATVCELED